jgi:hypothetical protein
LEDKGGQAEQPPPLHFDYIPYSEFDSLPAPDFLIDGFLVSNAANLIFGASNSYKTMLAVDAACSIATGRDWQDERPIKGGPGRVLYIATEGRNGVCRSRIRGWMEHYDVEADLRQNIEAFRGEIFINEPEHVDHLISDLIAKGGEYKLIVVDVAAGTIAGSESDDETAKAWVRGIQRLIEHLRTTVLVLHHTGWADQTRARGHTHIWGSFDGRLKAEGSADDLICTLTVDRIKDGQSAGFFGFRLDQVCFGTAGLETTLVPVLDDDVKPFNQKAVKIGANQKLLLDALDQALDQNGQPSPGFTGMPTGITVTTVSAWERHALPKLPQPDERRKKGAFKDAMNGLAGREEIKTQNEFVWRTSK